MNILRNIILTCLIIFILISALLYCSLQSPRVWGFVIEQGANKALKKSGLKVHDVKVAQQEYSSELIKAGAITAVLVKDQETYHLQLNKVHLDNWQSLFKKDDDVVLNIDSVNMNSDGMNGTLRDIKLISNFSNNNESKIPFQFAIDEIGINQLNCQRFNLKGALQPGIIDGIDARTVCYEGKIGARFQISYDKMFSYHADIVVDQINLSGLEQVNRDVFSNLTGLVSGNFKIAGDAKNISSFSSDWHIVSDGKIRAELLKNLLQYIPPSTQRKELEELIKKNGLVNLEKGVVHLESVGDQTISSVINLESRKLNLNTNLTVDVNVEGGIKNYYKHLMKSFN